MADKEFIDSLLTARRMCRLGVTRKDGSVVIRPIWFLWENQKIVISTKVAGLHTKIVKRDPRISIVVDKDDPPYAAVVCEGRVELIEGVGKDHELLGKLCRRYLGEQMVDKFLSGPTAQVERVRFIVHPKRWTIWNQGANPPVPPRSATYL